MALKAIEDEIENIKIKINKCDFRKDYILTTACF